MPALLTPPAAGVPTEVVHYAFAFELTGSRNEQMMCPMDSHVCRGRWEAKNLVGQTPDERFSELPTLPGLVFVINTKKREIRRFDPLILPDNARLLKFAQKTLHGILGEVPTPERGRLWKECDTDFLKTFVYWWWKLAGCKRAKIVKGIFPKSLEDIRAMPGHVNGEPYNQSSVIIRAIPNEQLKWRPPTDDDYANREPGGIEELPDPFVDVPTDPSAYLDRPAATHTHVTGGTSNGRRSASDVLMDGAPDLRDDEPDIGGRV